MSEYNDDLRKDILDAFQEHNAPPPEPDPERLSGNRDEKGRFAAKEAAPAEKSSEETAAPQTEQAAAEPAEVLPPRNWKPEAKAAFLALSPEVRQAVLDHQAEIDRAQQEFQPKAQFLEKIQTVLAPHKDRWALNGADEIAAIQQLAAASEMLDRDPVNTLLALARQY